MHPATWALIAMAAAFGAVAAYALFFKQPVAPANAAPGPGASALPGGAPAPSGTTLPVVQPEGSGSPVELGTVDVTANGAPAKSAAVSSGGASKAGGEDATSTAGADQGAAAKPCDPSDPFCQSVAGPNSAGTSQAAGSASGGLTPEQAQSVVAKNSKGVSRSCAGQVTTGEAKVSVTITIGPGGNVQSARASGGGGNPGLVSCVTGKVKGWKFPSSGDTSTVTVPFRFIQQQ